MVLKETSITIRCTECRKKFKVSAQEDTGMCPECYLEKMSAVGDNIGAAIRKRYHLPVRKGYLK